MYSCEFAKQLTTILVLLFIHWLLECFFVSFVLFVNCIRPLLHVL